ncbi:MAG: GxxExxY protein [Candidatus Cloacimonas sp. 4484_143]|nr:MAG: GxxExxY protein [Candidatus Cloacimonas sp. 4484_143]
MIYYKKLSDKIIECAIEVHRILGNGFLEKVYENSLMFEFKLRLVPAMNQVPISVYFKNIIVGEYFADIIVDKKIILELKVVEHILPIHNAQLLHYLKATNYKVGYVINFGAKERLEFKRWVN